MVETVKRLVLALLKVPPEPHPPAGAPGSLHVFRAAPNFFRLALLRWGFSQASALAGLIIALVALRGDWGRDLIHRVPPLRSVEGVVLILEVLGVAAFLLQLPFTLAATRLDYDLRWYLVTDRSLRIRSGVWVVEELTMTYANIQELTIHQGPLQRLLGIADLKVRSAGGGGAQQEGQPKKESHVGYFHGVDNATEIRDLILSHLRRQRDTGLGDPDSPVPEAGTEDALAAAREVLEEARALRAAVTEARARDGSGASWSA